MTYPYVIKSEERGLIFTLNANDRAIISSIPGNFRGEYSTDIERKEFAIECRDCILEVQRREYEEKLAAERAIKHKPIETWTATDALNLLNQNAKSSAFLCVEFAHITE